VGSDQLLKNVFLSEAKINECSSVVDICILKIPFLGLVWNVSAYGTYFFILVKIFYFSAFSLFYFYVLSQLNRMSYRLQYIGFPPVERIRKGSVGLSLLKNLCFAKKKRICVSQFVRRLALKSPVKVHKNINLTFHTYPMAIGNF
jgi:hypothetical protein